MTNPNEASEALTKEHNWTGPKMLETIYEEQKTLQNATHDTLPTDHQQNDPTMLLIEST
jgi:hypothetical protein